MHHHAAGEGRAGGKRQQGQAQQNPEHRVGDTARDSIHGVFLPTASCSEASAVYLKDSPGMAMCRLLGLQAPPVNRGMGDAAQGQETSILPRLEQQQVAGGGIPGAGGPAGCGEVAQVAAVDDDGSVAPGEGRTGRQAGGEGVAPARALLGCRVAAGGESGVVAHAVGAEDEVGGVACRATRPRMGYLDGHALLTQADAER